MSQPLQMHSPPPAYRQQQQQQQHRRRPQLPKLDTGSSSSAPVREYYVPIYYKPAPRTTHSSYAPPPAYKPRSRHSSSLGPTPYRPSYPTTYAGSRHSCSNPYDTILDAKRATSLSKPPIVWTRKDYVPFGGSKPSAEPSACSREPEQTLQRSNPEQRSKALMDEISAMVQAEIDEIERELMARGAEAPPGAAAKVIDPSIKAATSATLSAPFSDVYEEYVDEEVSDSEVAENTQQQYTSVPESMKSICSSSSSGLTGATEPPLSPVELTESFDSPKYSMRNHHDERHAPLVASLELQETSHVPLVVSLPELQETRLSLDVEAFQAEITTLLDEITDSVKPARPHSMPTPPTTMRSVAETTAEMRFDRDQPQPQLRATPTPALTPTTGPTHTAIATPPTPSTPADASSSSSLFDLIRRTLTFKEKLWTDLDEEEDGEAYTDEFNEVVEEYLVDADSARSGMPVRIRTVRRQT